MTSKFAQLCTYLASKTMTLKIRDDQFSTETDGGRIEPGGQNETEAGFHLMDFFYTGTLYFERLPEGSLPLLLVLITSWLSDNDDGRARRGLEWPRVDFIDLGSRLLDVLVEIDFVDMFFAAEDEAGEIEIGDNTYSIDGYELAVAERGEVNGGPTDA